MVKRISGWWAGIQPTTIVLGTGLPVRHGSGHAKRTQRAVTACGATTVAWPARAHRRTRGPGEGGATTVGAAATHLVAAVGAHPSGGSTARDKKGGGSSTFQGGGGVRWLGRASTRSCS
jgi:hypothetical protein